VARPRYCYVCRKGEGKGTADRLKPSVGLYLEPELLSDGSKQHLLARLCIRCYNNLLAKILGFDTIVLSTPKVEGVPVPDAPKIVTRVKGANVAHRRSPELPRVESTPER